ncbi:hypothetical protein CRG98_014584 [Punica granatum]|uniref:Uncharacterized protein n=1 Tax=Punica granatum TaxID=22663 RepID=A0A2I0K8Y5_PUNGR|nr:hypothetical protein CRG98_014584 [Punica granatum]
MSECLGVPGTRKPVSLRLDDRSEVVRFCLSFAPLRAVLLVSAYFVLWPERFTCQPRLEIDIRRRPRNPRTGLFQCFPSVLMCSETTVISVCQKRVPKACREVFVTIETSLERSSLGVCRPISGSRLSVRESGLPGALSGKASAEVRGCPGLSRRLLKCARSRRPHVRAFASDCQITNSNLSFGRESLCRQPVGQNGVLTACPSLVGCLIRGCNQRS